MGRLLKKLGLGLLLAILVVGALNFKSLQRLVRVNAMFDADEIVYNFSHLHELMQSTELVASGTPHIWPVDIQPLPETYVTHGDTKNVAAALENLQTTALVVVKDGTIIFEDYYKGTQADDLRISWSMSKSFVSALTGLAIANGDIADINDPVTKYVPMLAKSGYNDVPLVDVMNMASGVKFNEDYLDFNSDINKMGRVLALGGSLDKFSASIVETNRASGEAWQYVSIDTHVISMVLRAATGETLQDYFVENLWSKIGASANAYYLEDKKGNAFALGGLMVRTRDYALFGELFRNGGKRGDVQIIPADWVAQSTAQSAPPPAGGNAEDHAKGEMYGYQWWLPSNSDGEFFAVGIYGQFIYINPKAGIVIAKNAAHREFMEAGEYGDGSHKTNMDLFRAIAEHYSDWETSQ